jgi:hypothetical protein
MLSCGPGESYSGDPEDRARGRGIPMSKWAIVFNHSDGQFWAYPWEPSPDDQLKVSEKKKLFKENAGVELSIEIWKAPDWDEAMTQARKMNESRHFHEIDTLRRYATPEYFP